MTTDRLAMFGAVALLLAAAPAGAPAQTAAPLKVYAPGEIAPDRYTVVRRLWVEEWRSAYEVPRHATSGQAIAGLLEEAARHGADAVVNLYCVNDPGDRLQAAGFYCYGLGVKRK